MSMEIKKWTGERKRIPYNSNVDKIFNKFFEFVNAIKVIKLTDGTIILGFVKHEVLPDMREYLVEGVHSLHHVREIDPNKNEKSDFYTICEVSKIFIPSKPECVIPHIDGKYRKINKDHIISMDYPTIDILKRITFM